MEKTNLFLDDRTDKVTKQILENVIMRKQKFDFYKQRHIRVMWITVFLSFLYFLYLYFTIIKVYSFSFTAMFSAFVADSNNLMFLIITVGMYGYMNLLREKMDKAEADFHALRCEIVDRSKDLWKKEDAWENRHIIFEMMKEKYDINLYHEKK